MTSLLALLLSATAAALVPPYPAPLAFLDPFPALPPPGPLGQPAPAGVLQEVFSYNRLDYNLPLGARIDGYDPSRNVFTGLEVTADRLFLAVPRLYPGVPSTLNFVPRSAAVPNPPLEPYPGWEWQTPDGLGGEASLSAE
jgi:hypothetical protein